MKLFVPDPISVYFKISNGAAEAAHVTSCFAPDAVVVDEGRTYQGHGAIEDWLREARRKSEYTVDPVGVSSAGGRVTVSAKVVGNFPGSPVQLDHVFDLVDGKIRSLEIR